RAHRPERGPQTVHEAGVLVYTVAPRQLVQRLHAFPAAGQRKRALEAVDSGEVLLALQLRQTTLPPAPQVLAGLGGEAHDFEVAAGLERAHELVHDAHEPARVRPREGGGVEADADHGAPTLTSPHHA